MKKNLLLWSVLMGSLVSFSSCTDKVNDGESGQPTFDGTNIGIGAAAGYDSMNGSRTIYPGIATNGVEKINWVTGDEYKGGNWVADEIRVYSAEALPTNYHTQWADYKLVSHTEKNPAIAATPDGARAMSNVPVAEPGAVSTTDTGKFTVAGKDPSGLKWNPDFAVTQHKFYAVYPSANLNPSVGLDKVGDQVIFKGTLSSSQGVVGFMKDPTLANGFMAMPVMRQNYMWAVHTATAADQKNNAISLDFRTIPTTLELDLVCPSQENLGTKNSIELSSILLTHTGKVNLTGKFTADMSVATESSETGTSRVYPNVTILPSTEAQNTIEIRLQSDETQGPGITLKPGEHLKVRFLMLPVKDLKGEDLKLTIRGPYGQKSHALASAKDNFVLQPNKLNRVKNIPLPVELNTTNWISLLDDRILLSQLSIPGTGSSYLHTNVSDAKTYAQVKTVEEQWNMGIRCFDITSGRLGDVSGKPENETNFADAPLRIDNKTTIGTTVGEAFKTLLAQVKKTNPDGQDWKGEFGMMILRYQPGALGRGVQEFVDEFEAFFSTLDETRFCLYKPNMTISDARGKIMVILCPTSEGEDKTVKANNQNYLLVDGNGSLPDKFYRRGYYYTVGGKENRVSNICGPTNGVTEAQRKTTAEHYIVNPNAGTLSHKTASVDFRYPTNQVFDAYFQDWTRVMEETGNHFVTHGQYKWPSSYNEKLENVKATFNKAVADKESKENLVYINSLCGFLVGANTNVKDEGQYVPIYNSWPAFGGDIKALADKMNKDFYQYMYKEVREGRAKGPMGVVLMNFVGDPEVAGSTLMPNMVISNNFSFPLLTGKPGENTKPEPKPDPEPQPGTDLRPDADGSYDAGGWLWGK